MMFRKLLKLLKTCLFSILPSFGARGWWTPAGWEVEVRYMFVFRTLMNFFFICVFFSHSLNCPGSLGVEQPIHFIFKKTTQINTNCVLKICSGRIHSRETPATREVVDFPLMDIFTWQTSLRDTLIWIPALSNGLDLKIPNSVLRWN